MLLCLNGEGVLCLKSDGVPVEPSRPPGGVESSPSPLSCPPSWKPSSLETLLLLFLPCTGMCEPLTSRGPCIRVGSSSGGNPLLETPQPDGTLTGDLVGVLEGDFTLGRRWGVEIMAEGGWSDCRVIVSRLSIWLSCSSPSRRTLPLKGGKRERYLVRS